jgi:hypothetical protein
MEIGRILVSGDDVVVAVTIEIRHRTRPRDGSDVVVDCRGKASVPIAQQHVHARIEHGNNVPFSVIIEIPGRDKTPAVAYGIFHRAGKITIAGTDKHGKIIRKRSDEHQIVLTVVVDIGPGLYLDCNVPRETR